MMLILAYDYFYLSFVDRTLTPNVGTKNCHFNNDFKINDIVYCVTNDENRIGNFEVLYFSLNIQLIIHSVHSFFI